MTLIFFSFYLFIYYVFIFGHVGSSLLHMGLSLVVVSGGYFVTVRGLLIVVASRCGAWALGALASVVVARGLSSVAHGL